MKSSQIINLTPHAIKLNCGVEFPPSGTVLRVEDQFSTDVVVDLTTTNDPEEKGFDMPLFTVEGSLKLSDLPKYDPMVRYIVSSMVLAAIEKLDCNRYDFYAPATGHPEVVRNEKGHIVSVPGFVKLQVREA